ncbi:MAG: DUF4199 domain-containing protein [Bacteroidaceae bacterium]|nr:DUF4199 domain-containing protein [Bacteroidaceae bacterium]
MEQREQQPSMVHYAMNFGTVVGIYYIAKFCLFPMSLRSSLAGVFFIGLTLVVPFLIYRLTRLYRDHYMGGNITFVQALAFAMLTMGFGSLLASAAHYIYFAFIDGGAIVNTLEQNIEQMESLLSMPLNETAITDSVAIATSVPSDSITNISGNIIDDNMTMTTTLNDYITMLRTTTAQIKALTPIDMTLGMLSNNLSWSIIVAVPVAALTTIKRNNT